MRPQSRPPYQIILNKFFYWLKKEVKANIYKGDVYLCPFCGFKGRSLYKIGRNFPVNVEKKIIGSGERRAGCHKCDSTDRERLLFLFLKDYLKIFSRNNELEILHIAPEKNLSNVLLKHGFKTYSCGDLFTEGYEYPAHVLEMDVTQLKLEDNSYDLVICNHVLEHVPNDRGAMKEIYRVLKPGGIAIIQVPISAVLEKTFEDLSIIDPRDRELTFGQSGHLRIYGKDYVDYLGEAGFQVRLLNATKVTINYKLYGLNKLENIYICTKKMK